MKLTELQLQHIEDLQKVLKSHADSIERIREAASQLYRVGIEADFAMPDAIKVVHYVFKSAPITIQDIKEARATRDAVAMAEADKVLSQPIENDHAIWCGSYEAGRSCTCGIGNARS